MSSRLTLVGLALAAAAASGAACTDSDGAQPPPRPAPAADSARRADSAHAADSVALTRPARRARPPALPPLADSIAQLMVFAPRGQMWFAAAARGKRMLLDLGRADIDVRADTARFAAFQLVANHRATLRVGARLR
ncbi:MAG TPA: hypothetical protein VNA89_04345, partial [Gemmatimonadaceae bacterium]|nr:hypothetical protein [Gemmatimonadaceae bacterium]